MCRMRVHILLLMKNFLKLMDINDLQALLGNGEMELILERGLIGLEKIQKNSITLKPITNWN